MLTIPRKLNTARRGGILEISRNTRAWRALQGIWKGKKAVDPVRWQKRMRQERGR